MSLWGLWGAVRDTGWRRLAVCPHSLRSIHSLRPGEGTWPACDPVLPPPGPALRCGRTSPSPGSEAGHRRTSEALIPPSRRIPDRGSWLSAGSRVTTVPGGQAWGQPGGPRSPCGAGCSSPTGPSAPHVSPAPPEHHSEGAATPGRVRRVTLGGWRGMRPAAPWTAPWTGRGACGWLCTGDMVSPEAMGGSRGPRQAPRLCVHIRVRVRVHVRGVRRRVSVADPRL